MEPLLDYSLTSLPHYLAYAGSLAALMAVFVLIYLWITPYKEIRLIRQGNSAAATSFAGVLIGFAIPVTQVATSAGTLIDILIWSAIALVGQIVAFLIASRLMGDFRRGIEEGKSSYGILLGGLSIATGMINAASLSYG